jgi:uncharacterized membrane protein YdjX (TVP38/TMEM64 family)
MKKMLILLLLFLGIASIVYYDPGQYLTIENLKTNRDLLESFYQDNNLIMIGGYIAIYMMIGLFLLPGSTFLSIGAGVIFGPALGIMVVNIGSTLGATLAFLVSRYLLQDWIEKRFSKKIQSVNDNLCENPANCVLFLRLVPLFPFFAVNISLSLSQVPLKYFFFGTMIGTLPATFVYVNAGNNLASINSFSDLMSRGILGAFTLLGILVLVPVIYKKIKSKKVPRENI